MRETEARFGIAAAPRTCPSFPELRPGHPQAVCQGSRGARLVSLPSLGDHCPVKGCGLPRVPREAETQPGLELGAQGSGRSAPSSPHLPTASGRESLCFGPSCGESEASWDRYDGHGAGSPGLWLHGPHPGAAAGQSFSLLLIKWWPVTEHEDNAGTFQVSSSVNTTGTCWDTVYVIDEETEAQRGGEAALGSAAGKGQTEPGFEPSSA